MALSLDRRVSRWRRDFIVFSMKLIQRACCQQTEAIVGAASLSYQLKPKSFMVLVDQTRLARIFCLCQALLGQEEMAPVLLAELADHVVEEGLIVGSGR